MFRSLIPNFAQIRQVTGKWLYIYLTPFGEMPVTTKCDEARGVLMSTTPNFMKIVQTAWSAHKALSLLLKNGRNALFGKGNFLFLCWHDVTLTDVR